MNKFEVRNMDLYYGSFHALKNINIDIPEKEITAFIGPSGCGKSTFLKSLNRMNDLVEGCRISGDIKLDGVDIYKDKMDVNVLRKRVGMVFQKPNPFPMSIYLGSGYGEHETAQEEVGILLEHAHPLALNVGAHRAADVRALVPQQAGLPQGVVDDIHSALHVAALVGVLDAEDEGAAIVLGHQVGVQGRAQVANVHITRRRGSKTGADSIVRHNDFSFYRNFQK